MEQILRNTAENWEACWLCENQGTNLSIVLHTVVLLSLPKGTHQQKLAYGYAIISPTISATFPMPFCSTASASSFSASEGACMKRKGEVPVLSYIMQQLRLPWLYHFCHGISQAQVWWLDVSKPSGNTPDSSNWFLFSDTSLPIIVCVHTGKTMVHLWSRWKHNHLPEWESASTYVFKDEQFLDSSF